MHTNEIGYLYINGLGDGKTKPHDRAAQWWWKRRDVQLHHAHVNWFDEGSLEEKVAQVKTHTQEILKQYGSVALIGSSAGGSLALHAFYSMSEQNVCLIAAHARLKVGDYTEQDRASLYHRAHMNTNHPSLAFFDSVTRAETEVIPQLTHDEKQRILTLSSRTDMIVPPHLMTIEGVRNHQSFAFSHIGGYLAHLVADRDLIIDFAKQN